MYHAYFYILHLNNYRLIESEHEAAKYSAELHMRKNRIIALPVNILMGVVRWLLGQHNTQYRCGTPASWATRHTTVFLDPTSTATMNPLIQ